MTNFEPKDAAKYDSNKLRNTHQFITIQAMNILSNTLDKITEDEKIKENFKVIESNLEEFKKGCIAPDYGKVGIDRDYALYQDHFFDPDTGKNFTSSITYPLYEIKDTAESQARNYFSRAIATWLDGDKVKGIYYLGKALHYFEDANEPHHCLNWTGGAGTAHTRFEYYAEEVKNNYAINSIDVEKYKQFEDVRFIEFISNMVYKHAKMAKGLEKYVALKNTWKDWDTAIDIALKNAQEGVAVIIYRFLKEITHPQTIEITNPIGKFHVIVKVGDMQFAGTDNSIYFGIKTKNKKDLIFICDLAGNDFERGTTGCYQFEINKDIKFEDIKGFYLKKQSGGLPEDSVNIEKVEIYIQGKRIVKNELNKWMYNNDLIELK